MYLPLEGSYNAAAQQYNRPFLWFGFKELWDGDVVNIFTEGTILSWGPRASATQQGIGRESWVLEYVEDPDRFDGGHILIRNATDMQEWWHYYDEDLRLAQPAGTTPIPITWRLNFAGAIQYANVTPLHYGDNAGTAWPPRPLLLPSCEDASWESDVTWDGLVTEANGWTTGVAQYAPPTGQDNGFRPCVTFTRNDAAAWDARPVAWVLSEQHDADIQDADATTTTTEAKGELLGIEWTQRAGWRGASGFALFAPANAETEATWRPGSKVVVNIGWSSDAPAALQAKTVATGYLTRVTRAVDGALAMGAPVLSVEFGDGAFARMDADIIDLRQAGGMTVGDFGRMVGNRLELPASMISIASAVEDTVIPAGDPFPSAPAFAAGDGANWVSLLDTVCNALDIRWGFNVTGQLFFDAGAPTYTHGTSTITLTLDASTTTEEDTVFLFAHEAGSPDFYNAFKATMGLYQPDPNAPFYDHGWSGPYQQVHYWVESYTDRKAGIGRAKWRAVTSNDAGDCSNPAALLNLLSREWYKHKTPIVWESTLRVDIEPDVFVEVDDIPNCDIAAGTVFQVIEHRLHGSLTPRKVARSQCIGVVVYEP